MVLFSLYYFLYTVDSTVEFTAGSTVESTVEFTFVDKISGRMEFANSFGGFCSGGFWSGGLSTAIG